MPEPPPASPGTSLHLLVLRSRHPDRLRDFFLPLDVSFTAEQHGSGPLHYATTLGGVVLELYPLAEHAQSEEPPIRLGFCVRDLARTLQGLEATGTPVISRPRETEWGLRAVVRDPDGRAVELTQPHR